MRGEPGKMRGIVECAGADLLKENVSGYDFSI